MAVNNIDGPMFVSVVFYPIAAGVGAAHAGAGWFTVFFIAFGFVVGIGVIYIGRKLIYSIGEFGLSFASKMPTGWVQQVLFLPFFLFCMISPYAIVYGTILGVWSGSIWMVKHLL